MPIVFSFMDPTGNYKFSETECLFEFQSDGSCLFTLDFQGASQGSYLDNPDETIIEIEPEVVYPKDPDTYSATVIGSNGEYTIPFDWQPDRYYRILLQLIPSEITQNALFSVKICDLSSNTWTNLFEIDTSVSEVAMKNNFEGWMLGSSDDAENRSMVISNIRALPYGANKDGWVYAENVELQIYDSGLYGSYFFTTKGSSILMFATGIRNVWDLPDSSSTYPLEPGDTSPPYN